MESNKDGLVVVDRKKAEETERKYRELGYLDDPIPPDKNKIDLIWPSKKEIDQCQYCGKHLDLNERQKLSGGKHFCSNSHKSMYHRRKKKHMSPVERLEAIQKLKVRLDKEEYNIKSEMIFEPAIKQNSDKLPLVKKLIDDSRDTSLTE